MVITTHASVCHHLVIMWLSVYFSNNAKVNASQKCQYGLHEGCGGFLNFFLAIWVKVRVSRLK